MILVEVFHICYTGLFGICNKGMGNNMLKKLKKHLHNKEIIAQFKEQHDIDFVKFIEEFEKDKRISMFNEKFVVKNFGYKDHHDYHHQASGHFVIPQIKVPTLFFHALDDPLIGRNGIDWKSIAENPNTILATTEEGGHTAHHESILHISKQWWIDVSLDFLKELAV